MAREMKGCEEIGRERKWSHTYPTTWESGYIYGSTNHHAPNRTIHPYGSAYGVWLVHIF